MTQRHTSSRHATTKLRARYRPPSLGGDIMSGSSRSRTKRLALVILVGTVLVVWQCHQLWSLSSLVLFSSPTAGLSSGLSSWSFLLDTAENTTTPKMDTAPQPPPRLRHKEQQEEVVRNSINPKNHDDELKVPPLSSRKGRSSVSASSSSTRLPNDDNDTIHGTTLPVAHCFYREYPIPPPASKTTTSLEFLPLLAEVFASPDRTHVLLVAESHENCHGHDRHNSRHLYSRHYPAAAAASVRHDPVAGRKYFDCVFELDGSRTTSLPLRSKDPTWRMRRLPFVLIACPIPRPLQSWVPLAGATQTHLFVSLQPHRAQDKTAAPRRPAQEAYTTTTTTSTSTNHSSRTGVQDPVLILRGNQTTNLLPRIAHIPICSHAWPTDDTRGHDEAVRMPELQNQSWTTNPPSHPNDPTNNNNNKHQKDRLTDAPPPCGGRPKYRVSLMTRVSLFYNRSKDGQPLYIHPLDIVAWLEYHVRLSLMDHVYLYDDTTTTANATTTNWIRNLCQPFIEAGLLTYIHYPKSDVTCNVGKRNFFTAQHIALNAALRRYESETEWMGHWDVDEFLVLPAHHQTLVANRATTTITNTSVETALWEEWFGSSNRYDEILFPRYSFGPCNNNHNNSGSNGAEKNPPAFALNMDTKSLCYLPGQVQNTKGLFRTQSVHYVFVHHAWSLQEDTSRLASSSRRIATHHVNTTRTGVLMAHLRDGTAAGTYFPEPSDAYFPNAVRTELKQHMRERFVNHITTWNRLLQWTPTIT